METILKKWWLIPLCVLSYYVFRIIGLLMIYLIDGVTGSGFLAFLIGILISGGGAALPIIIVVCKSERLNAGVKLTINIVSVLLFSALTLMSLITPQKEIEEFHRQQQEWENKQLEESTDIESNVL